MNIENYHLRNFADKYLQEVEEVCDTIYNLDLLPALEMIRGAERVWLAGNGGSATLASHMATDLQLAGIKALSLTDVAAITTYANDFSYAESLSKQVRLLCGEKDLLILISGSGNSTNIYQAILASQFNACPVMAILGLSGGYIGDTGLGAKDLILHLPTNGMGPAQDGHQILLHILCYYLIEQLKERK
jgi:phosphoheptose isomerase